MKQELQYEHLGHEYEYEHESLNGWINACLKHVPEIT